MTPRHIWVVKLSQDFENPLKKNRILKKHGKSAPVSISSATQGVILIIRGAREVSVVCGTMSYQRKMSFKEELEGLGNVN
jgi:hypothetical protein